jgi:hypothetical protein
MSKEINSEEEIPKSSPPSYKSTFEDHKEDTKEMFKFIQKVLNKKEMDVETDRPSQNKNNNQNTIIHNHYYGNQSNMPLYVPAIYPNPNPQPQPIIINNNVGDSKKETDNTKKEDKKDSKEDKKEAKKEDKKEEKKDEVNPLAVIGSIAIVSTSSYIIGHSFGELEGLNKLMITWKLHQERWNNNRYITENNALCYDKKTRDAIDQMVNNISALLERRYGHLKNKFKIAGGFALSGTAWGFGSFYLIPTIATGGLFLGVLMVVGTIGYIGYRYSSTLESELESEIRATYNEYSKKLN